MELPTDGQEYAHITFDTLPTGATVEASLDRTTWSPTEPGTGDLDRRFLLRGPNSTATQGVLVAKDSVLWIRLADMPEQIVREAGTIYLY